MIKQIDEALKKEVRKCTETLIQRITKALNEIRAELAAPFRAGNCEVEDEGRLREELQRWWEETRPDFEHSKRRVEMIKYDHREKKAEESIPKTEEQLMKEMKMEMEKPEKSNWRLGGEVRGGKTMGTVGILCKTDRDTSPR
jgi:exonuclease VII large subunit